MSYRIWNTALDHAKRFHHRTAPKMQMEPVLAGRRLRLRESMVIDDAMFEHNKANIELYKKWGVLDFEKVGGEKSAPVVENAPDPAPAAPVQPEAPPAEPVKVESQESPPAETTPPETKPQPKSPFKGKKHQ